MGNSKTKAQPNNSPLYSPSYASENGETTQGIKHLEDRGLHVYTTDSKPISKAFSIQIVSFFFIITNWKRSTWEESFTARLLNHSY